MIVEPCTRAISFIAKVKNCSQDDFVNNWNKRRLDVLDGHASVTRCALFAATLSRPHPLVPSLDIEEIDFVEMISFKSGSAHSAETSSQQAWRQLDATHVKNRTTILVKEIEIVRHAFNATSDMALSVVKRRTGLSDQQFHSQWAEHGAMAKKVRYLEAFTMLPLVRQTAPQHNRSIDGDFDGFAESRWLQDRCSLDEAPERQAWFTHGATFLGGVTNYLLTDITPRGPDAQE